MDDDKNYISEEKKIQLEEELKDLSGPKRQAILDVLGYAKSLGDLSENAEYHQAREEQSARRKNCRNRGYLKKCSYCKKG